MIENTEDTMATQGHLADLQRELAGKTVMFTGEELLLRQQLEKQIEGTLYKIRVTHGYYLGITLSGGEIEKWRDASC